MSVPLSEHPDVDDASRVLLRFNHLVKRAAAALAKRTGVDAEDLWSAGALGLLDAVKRFDAARGVKLEVFVGCRVRGAMLDELRRMDRLPRRLRGRISTLEKTRTALTYTLGRAPSRDEIATALDVDADDVDRLVELNNAHRALDDSARGVGHGERDGDADGNGAYDVAQLVVDRERADELRRAVARLPHRHQTLLSLRYVEEMTLKQIAAVFAVSEPRICQLHNAAIEKLRRALSTT